MLEQSQKYHLQHESELKDYISRRKFVSLQRCMNEELNVILSTVEEKLSQENDILSKLNGIYNQRLQWKMNTKKDRNELWNRKIYKPIHKANRAYVDSIIDKKIALLRNAHENFLQENNDKGGCYLNSYTAEDYFPFALSHVNCCAQLERREHFIPIGDSTKSFKIERKSLSSQCKKVEPCNQQLKLYQPTKNRTKNGAQYRVFKSETHCQTQFHSTLMRALVDLRSKCQDCDPRKWVQMALLNIDGTVRVRCQRRCKNKHNRSTFTFHEV